MQILKKQKRKTTYFILLFISISTSVFCQNSNDTTTYKRLSKFPLASFDYTLYNPSEYAKNNNNGEIRIDEYKVKLQFALKLKEKKTYLLNKLAITKLDIFANKDNVQLFNESYYSFAYSIGIIQRLKKRWKIIGIITPTLASDFNNKVSGHDFLLQSSIIASKRVNNDFEIGFGAAYSSRFGRFLVIPLLTYAYSKGHWTHKGVVPAYIASHYNFKRFNFGLKISTFGNVYNSTNEIQSSLKLDKLGYSRINFGPDIIIQIYKSIHLNLNSGITVRNRLYSIASQELEEEFKTKPKFFFNFGLSILK